MGTNATNPSRAGRVLGMCLLALLAVLVALAFIRRSTYPDGTFVVQERTFDAERLNPDLGDVVITVVPGHTTTADLIAKVGEPADKREVDGLELWVYVTRTVKVTERALFGLIPFGERTEGVESQMPVGVQGNLVVHTYPRPSADPAVKAAVESMWDAYTPGP